MGIRKEPAHTPFIKHETLEQQSHHIVRNIKVLTTRPPTGTGPAFVEAEDRRKVKLIVRERGNDRSPVSRDEIRFHVS